MIDNDEWNRLGTATFLFHIPGQLVRKLCCPDYPASDTIGIPIIILTGGVQFFFVWLFILQFMSRVVRQFRTDLMDRHRPNRVPQS